MGARRSREHVPLGTHESIRERSLTDRARVAGSHDTRAKDAGLEASRQNHRMLQIDEADFEVLVGEALDGIPPELTRVIDNVVILVEDESPADEPELLGLYEGTPLTERDGWYSGVLPDRITIYRLPTLRMCATYEEAVHEVRVTVVHEIAHHFGIDDERLHALGWG